ncbi:hypothetical protein Tco_0599859 [Tanacetum coccineum]
MVGAGHAAYTDRLHELARLVPHLVTLENKRIKRYIYGLAPRICGMVAATKPTIIQSAILKDGVAGPRMVNPLNAKNPTATRGECFEYGGTDHYKAACPRLNRAPGQGGNRPNQAMAIEGVKSWKQLMQARGRAFVMGAKEARQDPNIVTEGRRSIHELRSRRAKTERPCRIETSTSLFLDTYPDYPLPEKIKFLIDLIPRAMSSSSSPYRLGAPLKMEELSSQLRELQDKGFIRLISSPWGAPLSIKDKILAAQNEASEAVNAPAEMLRGLDEQMERRIDGALYYLDRIMGIL